MLLEGREKHDRLKEKKEERGEERKGKESLKGGYLYPSNPDVM